MSKTNTSTEEQYAPKRLDLSIEDDLFRGIPLSDDPDIRTGRKPEEEVQREIAARYEAIRGNKAKARLGLIYFDELDRSKPNVNWRAFDEVEDWDGERSLICKGVSQRGKTRAIARLLYNQSVQRGKTFIVLNEIDFKNRMRTAEANRKLDEFQSKLCNVDILFFDDLDKAMNDDGIRSRDLMTMAFGVIKQRMANRKITIMAYNASITKIFEPAGESMVQSLVERMKQTEYWQIVNFDQ